MWAGFITLVLVNPVKLQQDYCQWNPGKGDEPVTRLSESWGTENQQQHFCLKVLNQAFHIFFCTYFYNKQGALSLTGCCFYQFAKSFISSLEATWPLCCTLLGSLVYWKTGSQTANMAVQWLPPVGTRGTAAKTPCRLKIHFSANRP